MFPAIYLNGNPAEKKNFYAMPEKGNFICRNHAVSRYNYSCPEERNRINLYLAGYEVFYNLCE